MVGFRIRRLKQITISLLSVTLLFGICLLGYNHLVPTVVGSHVLTYGYNLQELEEQADLIVVVTVSGRGREEAADDEGRWVNTFTPVRVDKVFKGDVNPGDSIEIAEGIHTQRTPFGLLLYTDRPYLPLERKNSYLLFLSETQSGWLRIMGNHEGKLVWPPPNDLTPKNLQIMEVNDHYLELYQQVTGKYQGTD